MFAARIAGYASPSSASAAWSMLGQIGPPNAARLPVLPDSWELLWLVLSHNCQAARARQVHMEVIAEGMLRYPKNSVLADWHATSADRPELLVDDGIHFQPEGQRVYADLIAAHLFV